MSQPLKENDTNIFNFPNYILIRACLYLRRLSSFFNYIYNELNMYNLNYYLTRLLIGPVFIYLPYILGIFLFLSLKYFEPAYLCDGENIEGLKNILNEETSKYNEALKELNHLDNLRDVAEEDKEYKLAFHYELKSE